MSLTKLIPTILILFFVFLIVAPSDVSATHTRVPETDAGTNNLFSFFDLRDRESFVQVTNTANPDFINFSGDNIDLTSDITVHVQIWDVNNNCIENNFFDTYTPNDTHVYNLRDIQTNNGTPSGVVLPPDAYGIVSIALIDGDNGIARDTHILTGNMRIIDNAGYEYRTNSSGWENWSSQTIGRCSSPGGEGGDEIYTLNFNTNAGITFSDIIAITVDRAGGDFLADNNSFEVSILLAWNLFDVDIFDLNENAFSCRNVVFGCVDQDNPLLEALLEEVSDTTNSSASVAAFEYGINETIPHSRNGELLCPGNTISEGFVRLKRFRNFEDSEPSFVANFIGLNNGNGRGSMDFWMNQSCALSDNS